MARFPTERAGEILRSVMAVLSEHPDGMKASDVIRTVEDRVGVTDFEAADYPSTPGTRRFEKLVRFGTIAPVKAGWIIKSKGTWQLTEDGDSALKAHSDNENLVHAANRLYRKWKKAHDNEQGTDDSVASDEDASASVTVDEAEEAAWREIEDYLLNMGPYEFQDLVAALLSAMGYHIAWVAPPGKDGGIDIVAHKDPLGTELPRIKVQVKRWQNKVNVDDLRSFMAVLGDQDVGIFVCSGGFTKDAELEARQQENRRVMLVDLEKLFDLWVEHQDDMNEEARKLLPLRSIYFFAPSN